MTAADLDELQRLHAESVGDKWETDGVYDCYVFTKPQGNGVMIADNNIEHDLDAPPGAIIRARGTGAGLSARTQAANIRAIAATHNALPELLRLARLGLAHDTERK